MPYLTEDGVRQRAAQQKHLLNKSYAQVLANESLQYDSFDVFLSHSSNEPEEILVGIKSILEDNGLTVYVDKYNDPHLSPDVVTPETAETLRRRMTQSASLLYVYSQYSMKSRWMPWELGFFDGMNGKVGVVPVTKKQEEAFKGEEYLNLYPYVDEYSTMNTIKNQLWINKSSMMFARLRGWVKGTDQIRTPL